MFRTNDPIADFENWDAEQQSNLDRLPECSYCGSKIQDEFLYCINDEIICEDCLNDHFRKETEDYAG